MPIRCRHLGADSRTTRKQDRSTLRLRGCGPRSHRAAPQDHRHGGAPDALRRRVGERSFVTACCRRGRHGQMRCSIPRHNVGHRYDRDHVEMQLANFGARGSRTTLFYVLLCGLSVAGCVPAYKINLRPETSQSSSFRLVDQRTELEKRGGTSYTAAENPQALPSFTVIITGTVDGRSLYVRRFETAPNVDAMLSKNTDNVLPGVLDRAVTEFAREVSAAVQSLTAQSLQTQPAPSMVVR